VDGGDEMERHDKVQQESIWELLTTEKTYIADLRVVTEVLMYNLLTIIHSPTITS